MLHEKNPAAGHCRGNFTSYNVALQWLKCEILLSFSEIILAESYVSGISRSVSYETSKYRFWLTRDIIVGEESLTYLGLNHYLGQLEEEAKKKKINQSKPNKNENPPGEMHLAYCYRFIKTTGLF